jgi:oligopeptide transport system permease protein
MLRFLARRLFTAVMTLLAVITLTFFMMRAAPGGPFASDRRLSPEIERNVMARYGMNRPLLQQYASYLADVARGDLGPSLKYRDKSVGEVIAQGFPRSLAVGAAALVLALGLGGVLGLAAALRRRGALDHAAMFVAVLGVCIPAFVTAPLLVLALASRLGWLPTAGWPGSGQGVSGLRYLVLPVVVLALPQIAVISRLMRAGVIEALGSGHVRTARAKGLPEARIVLVHVLPSAARPLVSYLAPACAGLITGSLVVEQIFQLPGLGRSFVLGALQRDYTVVMGVVILYAGLILALNLAADLVQAALDPQVKLS